MYAMLRGTQVDMIVSALPAVFAGWTPVAIPDNMAVEPGWHYINGQWLDAQSAPAVIGELSLADAQAAKIAEAAAACDAVLSPLGVEYGAWEKQTWDQQAVEAAALMADPTLEPAPAAGTTDKIPCIRAMASTRGMELVELAQRILVNREAWLALSGNVIGQRQKIYDVVKACTKADDVRDITVDIKLPTA